MCLVQQKTLQGLQGSAINKIPSIPQCTRTDLARFMKTIHVRLVGRRSEVGFSHYLTLNWIGVNKLRLRLTQN